MAILRRCLHGFRRRWIVVTLGVLALAGGVLEAQPRHHMHRSNSAIDHAAGAPVESQGAASNTVTPIPVPSAALLEPQPEPACLFPVEVDPKSDSADRAKLEYERLCYKHAEIVVRSRLQLLQDSVSDTIKALSKVGPDSNLVPLEGELRPAEGASVSSADPATATVSTKTSGVVQAVPPERRQTRRPITPSSAPGPTSLPRPPDMIRATKPLN